MCTALCVYRLLCASPLHPLPECPQKTKPTRCCTTSTLTVAHLSRPADPRPLAPSKLFATTLQSRLACGPLNNMTPAVATGRLLCASEGPGGASERPGGSAGRHHRRAGPPEPNRLSRTTAEGTTGSFQPQSTAVIPYLHTCEMPAQTGQAHNTSWTCVCNPGTPLHHTLASPRQISKQTSNRPPPLAPIVGGSNSQTGVTTGRPIAAII